MFLRLASARACVKWVYGAMKQWWYRPGRTLEEPRRCARPWHLLGLEDKPSNWEAKFVPKRVFNSWSGRMKPSRCHFTEHEQHDQTNLKPV